MNVTRRRFSQSLLVGACWQGMSQLQLAPGQENQRPKAQTCQLATFELEVTPPLGHPLIGGLRGPAVRILDPLLLRGVVLTGDDKPLVLASIDWCELRSDAYDQFRDALAEPAGTTRNRVLLTCNHQHDAPYFDLTAQKLLDEAGLKDVMFQRPFFDQTLAAATAAVKKSLASAAPLTHIGVGQAKVERVACNRRVVGADGKPRFNRYSSARDPAIRNAPDGEIDPLLKTLSFWNKDKPLAAFSYFATHPMSYYGSGEVSGDFPGLARQFRQREMPDVMQAYVTGASGDIVAAKYNDGTPAGRQALAEELLAGMRAAWKATRRVPLERLTFRRAELDLSPPDDGPLAVETLQKTLNNPEASKSDRIHAAMGLSWSAHCRAGRKIVVPAIDFGPAQALVVPAEAFVAYQLAAQKMRPDQMIFTAGFGECSPGYIPTDQARDEGFVTEHGYCWVRPQVENKILTAIGAALDAPSN